MSQIDEEIILPEATAEQGDGLKLVPVAESIRYRRRAQSAEKKAETLAEQLSQANLKYSQLAEQLSGVETEQKLMHKLASAGAVDLEAAVLIVKARMKDSDSTNIDSVVEQLKKEKQYLFDSKHSSASATQKTAGPRDKVQNNQTVLERAAKKAAQTGNRADLQEYLKLRRNFV